VLDEVVRAAPSEGRTVLLASHELQRARPLATREVRISAGQVHEAGATLRAVTSERAEAHA
jgi:ABC-type histidine transport system ATPase subunit